MNRWVWTDTDENGHVAYCMSHICDSLASVLNQPTWYFTCDPWRGQAFILIVHRCTETNGDSLTQSSTDSVQSSVHLISKSAVFFLIVNLYFSLYPFNSVSRCRRRSLSCPTTRLWITEPPQRATGPAEAGRPRRARPTRPPTPPPEDPTGRTGVKGGTKTKRRRNTRGGQDRGQSQSQRADTPSPVPTGEAASLGKTSCHHDMIIVRIWTKVATFFLRRCPHFSRIMTFVLVSECTIKTDPEVCGDMFYSL